MGEERMNVPGILVERRDLTDKKLRDLENALAEADAPAIVDRCACVYATGSVGRGEMSSNSDLDIFITRDRTLDRPLTNLNEIRLKARLIEVARELKFPEFSDDGDYVKSYDVKEDFIKKLGTRTDDYENVLTARLLLLLESRPILGVEFYRQALDELLAVYWRDYSQNSSSFLPVFLMNDILRFWKTLCLNYEERTSDEKTGKKTAHPNVGKRRLLNYKLKYSRLLTCYSAIIYLQAILRRDDGTVSPEAAMEMVSATPTQRLEFVAETVSEMDRPVSTILENYAKFLDITAEAKATLQDKFEDPEFKRSHFGEAKNFGKDVFNLLHLIGEETELLRYIVV
jgi:predicted nucleotidyltransferase